MKHAFMVVTTNFELEPVLDLYVATYPDGQFTEYKVVFKSVDEHKAGEFSYIVVSKVRPSHQRPSFWDFVEAYCKLNNRKAAAQIVNHILPKLEPKGNHWAGSVS